MVPVICVLYGSQIPGKMAKKIFFVIFFIFGVLSNIEVVLNHGGASRLRFSSSFGSFSFCEFILYINFVVQRATAFKFGKISLGVY